MSDGTIVWLQKKEVANYLSVKTRTVDYLVRRGKLPPPVCLSGRLKRWALHEVDAYMKSLRQPQAKGVAHGGDTTEKEAGEFLPVFTGDGD